MGATAARSRPGSVNDPVRPRPSPVSLGCRDLVHVRYSFHEVARYFSATATRPSDSGGYAHFADLKEYRPFGPHRRLRKLDLKHVFPRRKLRECHSALGSSSCARF